jgi:hypothetical protein
MATKREKQGMHTEFWWINLSVTDQLEDRDLRFLCGVNVDCCLLNFDDVWSCMCSPTLPRNVRPPSSGRRFVNRFHHQGKSLLAEDVGYAFLRKVSNQLQDMLVRRRRSSWKDNIKINEMLRQFVVSWDKDINTSGSCLMTSFRISGSATVRH